MPPPLLEEFHTCRWVAHSLHRQLKAVMKNPYESTSSASCRYFVPSSLLASQVAKEEKRARKKRLKPEPLTYNDLFQNQDSQVKSGNVKKQTAANRATALRLYLKENHLLPEDVVGNEMRAAYTLGEARFADALRKEGRSSRSISNLRAALKPWRTAVATDDKHRAQSVDSMTPFQRMVTELVGIRPVRALARQAAIPASMLRGWIKGKQPRASNVQNIRRLEAFFGMERDSLAVLGGIQDGQNLRESVGQAAPNPYRDLLAENRKLHYVLRVPAESLLRNEWSELIRYKTDAVPRLKRLTRGIWTFSPHKGVARAKEWFSFSEDRQVPSANKCWNNVASYYGWMTLDKSLGGLGLPFDSLQTLAWLAVPDHVEAYLRWRMKRCNGKMTVGTLELLAVMTWMVRAGDGYLYQQAQFQKSLPEKYQGEDWHSFCTTHYEYCQKLLSFWKGKTQVSRNSFDTVRTVIDSPEPMQEIADMVQRMRNDRRSGSPEREAIWARDILLIKLLASNPIRQVNFITLTWNESNVNGHHCNDRGAVYQRVDGSWWIAIPKHLFKNRGASLRDYDSPINESVWKDLERYLFKYRPILLRWPTDLLLLTLTRDPKSGVTKKGQPYKQAVLQEHLPFRYIGNQVAKLTARYLRNSDGSRMHAFRNIVATAILKADGGDIKTAALVLHDKETTVEKHYSGIRSGDGSVRMAALLKKSFDRM